MFRPGKGPFAQRPLRRAALLAAALLLLWIATRYLSAPRTPPPTATDAEPTTSVTTARRSSSPITPGYVFAGMLLVGGGVYAWYLRRRNGTGHPGREILQSVGRLQLGPGQQVHLVECGNELLLLGATSGQITLLKTLSAESSSETTTTRPYRHESLVRTNRNGESSPAPRATNFADVLERMGLPLPSPASRR